MILPELGKCLDRNAEKKLGARGVEIRVKTKVTGYDGVRVALDWMLDLLFSKGIAQLPRLWSPALSEAEESYAPANETGCGDAAIAKS